MLPELEPDPEDTEEMFFDGNRIIHPRLGDVTAVFHEVLAEEEAEKQALMKEECALLARELGERPFIQDREGGGRVAMNLHRHSFHYWGQRLGYECWEDDQFCREYLRDNEYARVKSFNPNPKVGWRGPIQLVERPGLRFTKKY